MPEVRWNAVVIFGRLARQNRLLLATSYFLKPFAFRISSAFASYVSGSFIEGVGLIFYDKVAAHLLEESEKRLSIF